MSWHIWHKINKAEIGWKVSTGIHVLALCLTLVSFSTPTPLDTQEEAIAVEIVTETNAPSVTRGEKSAQKAQVSPPRAERVAEIKELRPASEEKEDKPAPAKRPDSVRLAPEAVIAESSPPPLRPILREEPPKKSEPKQAEDKKIEEQEKAQAAIDAAQKAAQTKAALEQKQLEAEKKQEEKKQEQKKFAALALEAEEKAAEEAELARAKAAAQKAAADKTKLEKAEKEKQEARKQLEAQIKQAEAESKAEKAAEAKARAIAAVKAQAEAREKAEALAEAKAEAQEKAVADAKAKAEAKAKADAKAKQVAEAKAKADAERATKLAAGEARALLQSKEENKTRGASAPEVSRTASLGTATATGQRLNPSMRSQLIGILRDQIEKCYSPPIGVSSGEASVPQLDIRLNVDGSLAGEPRIVRGGSSSLDRAVADAAVRAARRCAPFKIPTQFAPYFNDWRLLNVEFDVV
jgi:colicin import membrane protein